MAQKVLALCDSSIPYGSRLADYLEQQKGFPLRVMFFSDTLRFARYADEHTDTLLMMSEDIFEQFPKEQWDAAGKIFVLCRQREEPQEEQPCVQEENNEGEADVVRIYRYQSAGDIMRAIRVRLDGEIYRDDPQSRLRSEGTKLIGVYSPVKRTRQTLFSVTLGQFLTRRGRTLYINLESWSGFRALLGKALKPDITDLMFFAEKEPEQFMRHVEAMIDRIGSLEYIPPASAFMDLMAISGQQWLKVLRALRADGRFAYVILDITEQAQDMFALLRECDVIYTPEGEDCLARAKMFEYERLLELTEYGEIKDKTKKHRLPYVRRDAVKLEQMMYGEFAGYVRRIVEEDFGDAQGG